MGSSGHLSTTVLLLGRFSAMREKLAYRRPVGKFCTEVHGNLLADLKSSELCTAVEVPHPSQP